jgi:pSer/pThr/pTyr-binding forkhead associated (FHA) protein
MKIVLVEERNGQQLNERTFTQATIKIGRDPAKCHIVFDQTQWPMVSRGHAEIQLTENGWQITDTNSSFGTFVEGQKVAGTAKVNLGNTIQLGAGGPLLRVKAIETATIPAPAPTPSSARPERETVVDPTPAAPRPPSAAVPPPAAPPPPAQPPRPAAPPAGNASASAAVFVELVNAATGQRPLRRVAVQP